MKAELATVVNALRTGEDVTQTFTTGEWSHTPVAAIFTATRATAINTPVTGARLTFGFTDGVKEACAAIANWDQTQSGSFGVHYSKSSKTACLLITDHGGTTKVQAEFVSFGSGSVTVHITTNDDAQYLITVVLIYAENAHCDTQLLDWPIGKQFDQDHLGFRPNWLVGINCTTGAMPHATQGAFMGIAMASDTGAGGPKHSTSAICWEQGTNRVRHEFRFPGSYPNFGVVLGNATGNTPAGAKIDSFHADGFVLETEWLVDSGTTMEIAYLAIQMTDDGSQDWYIADDLTSADIDYDELSFEPGFAMRLLSNNQSWQENDNVRAETFGLSIMCGESATALVAVKRKSNNVDSYGAVLNGKSAFARQSGSTILDWDFEAFVPEDEGDDGGIDETSNTTPGTAVLLPTLFIENWESSDLEASTDVGAAQATGLDASAETAALEAATDVGVAQATGIDAVGELGALEAATDAGAAVATGLDAAGVADAVEGIGDPGATTATGVDAVGDLTGSVEGVGDPGAVTCTGLDAVAVAAALDAYTDPGATTTTGIDATAELGPVVTGIGEAGSTAASGVAAYGYSVALEGVGVSGATSCTGLNAVGAYDVVVGAGLPGAIACVGVNAWALQDAVEGTGESGSTAATGLDAAGELGTSIEGIGEPGATATTGLGATGLIETLAIELGAGALLEAVRIGSVDKWTSIGRPAGAVSQGTPTSAVSSNRSPGTIKINNKQP